MKIKSHSLWTLTIVFSLFWAIFIYHIPARADQSVSYINATFDGNAFLNSNKSLSFDITPLINGSDTWRYLDWAWNEAPGLSDGGSQIGIDVYTNGSQHNFVMSIGNAIDVKLLTGVNNSVTCDKRNPYIVDGKTYFQSVCWTPYTLAPGHTFRLKVYNNSKLGPTWFNASFEDLVTGSKLEIGSINVGDRFFSRPFKASSVWYGRLGYQYKLLSNWYQRHNYHESYQ